MDCKHATIIARLQIAGRCWMQAAALADMMSYEGSKGWLPTSCTIIAVGHDYQCIQILGSFRQRGSTHLEEFVL